MTSMISGSTPYLPWQSTPRTVSRSYAQRLRAMSQFHHAEYRKRMASVTSGFAAATNALLEATIQVGVPLEIENIRAAGGIYPQDLRFCEIATDLMASQGDDLQFRSAGGHKHPRPYERDHFGCLVFTRAFEDALTRSESADLDAKERDALQRQTDLSSGELCTILLRGLAILAFFPGGVRFMGCRFEANPDRVERVPPPGAKRTAERRARACAGRRQ